MEKETRAAGEWLMKEGEPGDAMYVIQTGKLEVYVGGKLTRHVGRGAAVGELALLYHTPRSASVKAIEDCVLFTLHRSKFREMLALSVSSSLVQRVAWMQAIPEFEPLDSQSTSRLAGAFSTMHLRHGETVVAEGDIIDRCFLIEYGSVEVTSTTESPETLKRQVHAALPKTSMPTSPSAAPTARDFPPALSSPTKTASTSSTTTATTTTTSDKGAATPREEAKAAHKEDRAAAGPGEGKLDSISECKAGESRALEYGPGTFFGMPVLFCAGKGKKTACWKAAPPRSSLGEAKDAEAEGGLGGASAARPHAFTGAVCPVTITAKEDLRLSYFTPSQFEAIVGPIREVFSLQLKGRPSLLKRAKSQRFVGKEQDERFTPEDFDTKLFLGTGSFGRVTLVTFKEK
ncbi:unnamed protein product [Sphacelaria rigidula]